MFYSSANKKIISSNIIDILTPISLAYWAQDDGSKSQSGFSLYTQSYSEIENLSLIKGLKDKFNLNCSIQSRYKKNTTQYIIYIKANSMSDFKNLVTPYFHSSMLYKLS